MVLFVLMKIGTIANGLNKIARIGIFKKTRFWNIFLKILFILCFSYILYQEIAGKQDLSVLWTNFKQNIHSAATPLILTVLFLMVLNWFLEAVKWKTIVDQFHKITIFKSLQAIIAGISVGIITPNRIGEYGGRLLVIDSKYNWHSIVSTLACSISQNIVNVTAGLFAFGWMAAHWLDIAQYYVIAILSLSTVCCLLALFVYFNLGPICNLLHAYKYEKWNKRLKDVSLISRETLGKVLIISLSRYCIYLAQFVILLGLFTTGIPLNMMIAGAACLFLFQSIIPLPPFLSVLVRGEMAILIWSGPGGNELSLISAVFLLWIINLLIPSFLGLITILRTNLMKSIGYG